jgi:hypothetical protein
VTGDGRGAARKWPGPAWAWAWRAVAGGTVAGGTVACSTLADTPAAEECRSDADCVATFVCAVDQGRCLPGNEAAPRAHLGFDIRERAASTIRFRVEVDGCDCTIDEEENIRELALRRSRVSQLFFLSATLPEAPPDDLLEATFELNQTSRYGQDPSPQKGLVDHPTFAGDPPAVVDTVLRWPRYHPLDEDVPPELVLWKVQPLNDLAPRYLGLLPPRTDAKKPCEVDADCCEPRGDCNPAPNFCDTTAGECTAVGQPEWTYRYAYEPACSRSFEGDVVSLDLETGMTGAPLPETGVRVRYADGLTDRFGIPTFGDLPAAERPAECDDDGDCDVPDEYCDPLTSQCFLALAGRPADRGSTTDELGTFRTQVFTYCEAQPNGGLSRRYAITAQPTMTGPRPTVDYIIDAEFSPPAQPGSGFQVGPHLCVPDWGPGVGLDLALVGQPRTLAGAQGEYTCCDVACLPATVDDVEAGAPPIPETCDGRTSAGAVSSVVLESHFVLDLAQWSAADCATPNPDPQGRLGSLVREATCSSTPGAPCRAEDLALGTAEEPRRYNVRFESEVGSVLASGDFVLELGPEAPTTVQTLELLPRVLVTGVVDVDPAICARRPTGEDCAAREAEVLAERLRLPDEPEGSVPAPYLHYASTFYDPVAQRDGAFVLPLDPGGVYVVTALPPAGAEGGPAGYAVVDLRADAAPLEPLQLELEDGVVVTLRLEQFDQRATMIPMDRGSYLVPGKTLQLPGTDTPIDLNEIDACWTLPGDGPQGCAIRRLIPRDTELARSQVGVVRFTARRSGTAQCPVRCPMSPPAE